MKTNQVENIVQYQLMTQILKKATGDSDAFQLVLESLINGMADNSQSALGFEFGQEDIDNLGYEAGMDLGLNTASTSSTLENDNLAAPNNSNLGQNEQIELAVDNASQKYGVDKTLIEAVINHESGYNPKAVSSAGAMGLMQLMPVTAQSHGVTNPFNIEQNVDGGTKFLRELLDMYGNTKELALSAYSAGPGTLVKRGVIGKEQIYKLPSETRNFVKDIMKHYGK